MTGGGRSGQQAETALFWEEDELLTLDNVEPGFAKAGTPGLPKERVFGSPPLPSAQLSGGVLESSEHVLSRSICGKPAVWILLRRHFTYSGLGAPQAYQHTAEQTL